MSRTKLSAILIIVFISLMSLAYGADQAERATLKDLQAVKVTVFVSVDSLQVGLAQALQADVELRLRQSRIKVQDDVEKVPGRPEYSVTLFFYKDSQGNLDGYAYSFSCQLEQDARLSRNNNWTRAVTWRSPLAIGFTNSQALREGARRSISELTDRFITDFLAENLR